MSKSSGVATWTPQPPWGVGLSENFPDIMLPLKHTDLNYMYDSGTVVVLNPMFKPETTVNRQIVQDIRNGAYNVEIDAWLKDLKTYTDTGRTCIVVVYPELNGPWVNYGPDRNNFDPQAAIDIYRYFVTRGRMLGLTSDKVLWCWGPNDIGLGRLSRYWPGSDVVDIVGGSAYCWGGLHSGEPWETPAQVIDPYVADVRKFTDKPIIITQTGSGEGDSRTPGWLDQLVEYTKGDKIEGFIWFSISEFTYQPGPYDFSQRVVSLGTDRPDHWFTTTERDMRVFIIGDTGLLDGLPLWSMADPGDVVLYVRKDNVPDVVGMELLRLNPSEIVIVGGPVRVSEAVEAVLSNYAPTRRVAGSSRFTTPIEIAKIVHPSGENNE